MTLATAARSAAIGSMLVLGACAGERETGNDIVWETERAAPSGTAPAAGAGPPGVGPDGCREYTQTVRINGDEHQAFGRACLQPDGSWRIYAPPALPAGQQDSGPRYTRAVPAYPYYYTPYYPPSYFFGSAFLFSHHHKHLHHRHHGHRHFHRGSRR